MGQDIGLKLLNRLADEFVVASHYVAGRDHSSSDYDCNPSPLIKFECNCQQENERGEDTADAVDQQFALPTWFGGAATPPMDAHAELRERESDKNVNRVENYESAHTRVRAYQDHYGR